MEEPTGSLPLIPAKWTDMKITTIDVYGTKKESVAQLLFITLQVIRYFCLMVIAVVATVKSVRY